MGGSKQYRPKDNAYLYVDERLCKRERCLLDILLIVDPSKFSDDNRSFEIYEKKTEITYVMQTNSVPFVSGAEYVAGMKEMFEYIYDKNFSHLIGVSHVKNITYGESELSDVGLLIVESNACNFSFETDVMPSYSIIMNKEYPCQFMASSFGLCKQENSDFSNILSISNGKSVDYPRCPIICHNCVLCGLCNSVCLFRKAIRNSITNTGDKIYDVFMSKDVEEFFVKNQRPVLGKDLPKDDK